jgi:hypothetical protein
MASWSQQISNILRFVLVQLMPALILLSFLLLGRVPLYISLKSRQVVGCAFTHCHVSYGSGPPLPAEVDSGAAMCHMAPDLAYRLKWALALPRVL